MSCDFCGEPEYCLCYSLDDRDKLYTLSRRVSGIHDELRSLTEKISDLESAMSNVYKVLNELQED